MLPDSDMERLGERRHVTVVLRLVLDRHEQLLYGEAVDVARKSACHFANWREMSEAVQAMIGRR